MRRLIFSVLLVTLVVGLGVQADVVKSRVILPDGNGAPYAEVWVGEQVYMADGSGRVEVAQAAGKLVRVKWLDLEAEVSLAPEMKFPNPVLYGPPYDEFDWDIRNMQLQSEWIFMDDAILFTKRAESQALLFDEYSDFVLRAVIFPIQSSNWYYIRFLFRSQDAGWDGYAFSLATYEAGQHYFVRFEGNWDRYQELTDPMRVGQGLSLEEEYELVITARGNEIRCYLRDMESGYTTLVSVVDDAASEGYLSILASLTTFEITQFAIFGF